MIQGTVLQRPIHFNSGLGLPFFHGFSTCRVLRFLSVNARFRQRACPQGPGLTMHLLLNGKLHYSTANCITQRQTFCSTANCITQRQTALLNGKLHYSTANCLLNGGSRRTYKRCEGTYKWVMAPRGFTSSLHIAYK